MARGVNKVILIGNLGSDPEIRYTPGGAAVANVSLATTDSWTDRKSGDKQDRTEWHRLVFWSKLAEIAGQYLKKGSKIYVEGRLQTRSWDDQQTGQKKYTTEIVVNDMTMLDNRGDGGGGGGQYGGGGGSDYGDPGPAGPMSDGGGGGGGQMGGGGAPMGAGPEDDDLPF